MTTLSDLARELNLSAATISNAFTGKGRMNDETRALIIETAELHGYQWKPKKKSEGQNFIILAEGLTMPFTTRMLTGIFEQAAIENIDLPIFSIDVPSEDINKPDVALLNQRIDEIVKKYPKSITGAIYVSRYTRMIPDLFKKHCFQTVALFCTREPGKPIVYYNDFQGAYLAVSHLIKNHCKHIAMIGGPIDSIAMLDRSNGYQRALLDNNIAYDPRLVYVQNWYKKNGYSMTHELLESGKAVDAIFAQNDSLALGAIEYLKEKNIACPGQVSVIGFDNASFTEYTSPRITTVNPQLEEMGRQAVRNLIALSNGEKIGNTILPCILVQRDSTQNTML